MTKSLSDRYTTADEPTDRYHTEGPNIPKSTRVLVPTRPKAQPKPRRTWREAE